MNVPFEDISGNDMHLLFICTQKSPKNYLELEIEMGLGICHCQHNNQFKTN